MYKMFHHTKHPLCISDSVHLSLSLSPVPACPGNEVQTPLTLFLYPLLYRRRMTNTFHAQLPSTQYTLPLKPSLVQAPLFWYGFERCRVNIATSIFSGSDEC